MEISSLEHADQRVTAQAPMAWWYCPFYNGERTPNLPNGKGCIMGLDVGNMTQANIMQASMEAAVFGLRAGSGGLCQGELRDRGHPPHRRRGQERGLAADDRRRLRSAGQDTATGRRRRPGCRPERHAGAPGCWADDTRQQPAALIDEHIGFDEAAGVHTNPGHCADIYQESYQRYLATRRSAKTPLFK